MNIGKIIYELRTHKGWTQKQLADKLDFSTSYIAKIEGYRERIPQVDTMVKIAAAFECPLPIIYMWAMESTDCYHPTQVEVFLTFKPELSKMMDLIYNLPKIKS